MTQNRRFHSSVARPLVVSGAALLALFAVDAVEAQVARDESVLRQRAPGYEAIGVQLGGFIMHPRMEAEAEYDDNVFRTRDDTRDDIVLKSRPSFSIATDDWFPVNLAIDGTAEIGRHVQYNEDDYEAFSGAARLSYSIADDLEFDIGGEAGRLLQRRGLDTDNASDEPTLVWVYEASANLNYLGDPLAFRFSPVYRRFDFVDSGSVDNDDRDRREYELGFRIAWKAGANVSLFVDPSYLWVDYDDRRDNSGVNRDSQGYDVRVGVGYDASELLYLEIGAGYFKRWYDDKSLGAQDGLSVLARAYWNPLETISIEAEFGRGISESDGATGAGSSKGAVATSAALRLGWLPLDSVLLETGVAWSRYDYDDIGRKDDFWQFDVGARYYLNEYFYAGLRYAHERRDSTESTLDYRDNRVMLTLGSQI